MFSYNELGKKRKRKVQTLPAALQEDLSELATLFADRWQRDPLSSSFQLFLDLWQEKKVSLLQSQAKSSKADPAGFAQLLYASCLDLSLMDIANLPQAAFGIFSAYAFYEASPLPHGPHDWKQCLSMGLVHPDNAKFTYRKRYRPKIRIHRQLFVTMQQLRQACLGVCSGTTKEGRLSSDILRVLDRLEFAWCESSGPRGVEALTYTSREDHCSTAQAPVVSEPLEEEDIVDRHSVQETTLRVLKSYQNALQAVEVTTKSKQAERVQTALKGLQGQGSWGEQIARLSSGRKNAPVEVAPQPRTTTIGLPTGLDHQSATGDSLDPSPTSYQLQLPQTIPKTVEQGITSAINDLLARGETLLLPQHQQGEDQLQPISFEATTPNNTFGRHDGFLTLQDEAEANFDGEMSDMSDEEDIQEALNNVGERGLSDEDEDVAESAAGLRAINTLLYRAKSSKTKARSKRRNNDAMSVADSSVGRQALVSLLAQAESRQQISGCNNSCNVANGISDRRAMSTRSRSVASVAESSVGRHALSSLIKQASKSHEKANEHGIHQRDGTSSINYHGKKCARGAADEVSVAASSVGRNALSTLIGQARGSKAKSSSPSKERGKRTRVTCDDSSDEGPNNLGRSPLSKQARGCGLKKSSSGKARGKRIRKTFEDLPAEESNDVSVAASSVGRKALSTLIGQARGSKAKSSSPIKGRGKRTKVTCDDSSDEEPNSLGRSTLSKQARGCGSKRSSSGKARGKRTRKTFEDLPVEESNDVSVAASSVGRNALSTLIGQARGSEAKSSSPSQGRGKRARVTCDDSSDEESSKLGRSTLSKQAQECGSKPSSSRNGRGKRTRNSFEELPAEESHDVSIAESSVGRSALSTLIKRGRRAKRKMPSPRKEKGNRTRDTYDDESIAESSVGRNALSTLIRQANATPEENEDRN